jgi:phosphate transport system protein
VSQHFQRQIDALKESILSLGALVEQSLARATQAVERRNAALAREVIDQDSEIDSLEVDVEEECLHTLALYQPVASDLRFIVSVLTINKDLERIGDLSASLAEQAVFLADVPARESIPFDLAAQSGRVRRMLAASLDALVNLDASRARGVLAADDEVDRTHHEVHRRIRLSIQQHPEDADRLLGLMSASRILERIADHAVNIAEDVVYTVEAEIVRHRHDLVEPELRLRSGP